MTVRTDPCAQWPKLAAIGAVVALAACNPAQAPVAPTPVVSSGPNLSRPCELLTPSLVAEVAGQPFFRTINTNSVHEGAVTCVQAVGAGGVLGLVRAVVHLPQSTGPAEVRFAALCRGEETSRLQSTTMRMIEQVAPPPPSGEAAAPPASPVSSICHLPQGGYAALLSDRVIEVGYEQANGSINSAISLRFATALSEAAAP